MFFNSLHRKINAALFLAFVPVFILSCFGIYELEQDRRRVAVQQIQQFLKVLIKQHYESLANGFFGKQTLALKLTLEELLEIEAIEHITLYTPDKQPFIGTQKPWPLFDPLHKMEYTNQDWFMEASSHHLIYIHHIQVIGESLGYLRASYSLEKVNQQTQLNIFLFLSVLLLTFSLMMFLFQMLLRKLVTLPVQQLTKAIQHYDIERPTQNLLPDTMMTRRDELGIFAHHVQTMQQSLEDKILQLKSMMYQIGANVAHEFRTPLLSIRGASEGLEQYLPELLRAYAVAREHDGSFSRIRLKHWNALQGLNERILSEIHYSNILIDMLLVRAKNSEHAQHSFAWHSMKETTQTALDRYPFRSETLRKLVHWDANSGEDFQYHGNMTLMTHVLFNLLKNALYSIQQANKGNITLWLEKTPTHSIFHFKDTGAGISNKVQPYIFDHLYTGSDLGIGTGVGLFFCKSTIQSFGGDIECFSEEGHYTHFLIKFPCKQHEESV